MFIWEIAGKIDCQVCKIQLFGLVLWNSQRLFPGLSTGALLTDPWYISPLTVLGSAPASVFRSWIGLYHDSLCVHIQIQMLIIERCQMSVKVCLTEIDRAVLNCMNSKHCGVTLDSGDRYLTSTIAIDRAQLMAMNCRTVSWFFVIFCICCIFVQRFHHWDCLKLWLA